MLALRNAVEMKYFLHFVTRNAKIKCQFSLLKGIQQLYILVKRPDDPNTRTHESGKMEFVRKLYKQIHCSSTGVFLCPASPF